MLPKLLKLAAWVAGVLLLIVLALAGTIFVQSNGKLRRTFAVSVQPVAVPADPASIAHGRHLAETRGCFECHGRDLAGTTVFDNGAMGRVNGPNLTRGTGGVGAARTDIDLVRAIRHGVAPDGRGLFLMPSADYAGFSDGDMGSLIAYIRSVPPVNKPSGPVQLGPVARGLLTFGKIKLDAERIDHAAIKPSTVPKAVSVDYGRYLAAGCTGCHGSNFSGGKIAIGPPDWPPAANLTPHAEGRIAKWSEENFLQALATGKRPDGSEINPVMPRVFGRLDDIEKRALWAFLGTLPAAATGSHDCRQPLVGSLLRGQRRSFVVSGACGKRLKKPSIVPISRM